MHNLHRKIERFFYQNRNRGISNLMLYIAVGSVVVYFLDAIDPSHRLFFLLTFDADQILRHGQVWRLFTYVFASGYQNPISLALMMWLYYYIGKIMESRCGTLKFNCFYLSGILILDVAALITGWGLWIDSFHYSLMLAFATLCPEDQLLFMFILPIRMKYLAILYLGIAAWQFALHNYFPLISILNYLLFFGADIKYLFPSVGRYHHVLTKEEKKANNPHAAPTPQWADHYRSKEGKKPYRHKCEVCGRTDTEYPELEFRYCSRCSGYRCYCMEHINNHTHIQE